MRDPSPAPLRSLVEGIPLDREPGLGALTMPGFLREVTGRYRGREALVLRAPHATVRWSYADLWNEARAVARALLACGVGKGSRVGILMTNRPEWISAFFGVGLAGGVAAALSTFSTAAELEYLLKTTEVSTLLFERSVAKKDFAAMLCELDPAIRGSSRGRLRSVKLPFLRRLVVVDSDSDEEGVIEPWTDFLERGLTIPPEIEQAAAASVRATDAAAIFFSSGTTSRPKGVLSAHQGIAIQCWRWPRIFALKDDVRAWTANGFMWSGNFALTLGGTLAVGGSIVLQRMFDAVEALELMQAERVSWPYAWPHQWAQLEAAPNWRSVDLGSLRYVDPSRPAARHPTFRAPRWTDPFWSYGNTETFTICASFSADTPPEIAAGSHGEVMPGNTIKIVDPATGTVLPRGERGEIAVKGPTLMLGYLGIPLRETLDREGFFHTGDQGYLDERGRLVFEGRLTEIIKTGGANVSPEEVDTALVECPGVKFAKTIGVPHAMLGEMVVSCIVPHEGSGLDEERVRVYLKQRLASYKVPRRVLVLREEEMALTMSAKIRANALRELAAERLSGAAAS